MRQQIQTPQQSRLQRLAKAGKREKARAYLEGLLQDNPLDKWAREELYHLLHGELFSFETAELEQQHYKIMRSRKHLTLLLDEYLQAPEFLLTLSPKELLKKEKELKKLLGNLRNSLDAPELRRAEQYGNAIRRQLGQRSVASRMRRPALWMLLSLGGLGCVGIFLQKHAEHAADVLASTRNQALWEHAENRLHACDTGLNRLFCGRVREEAQKLRNQWDSVQQRCRQLDWLLMQVEQNTEPEGIPISTQAQIERLLLSVRNAAPELNRRWQKHCYAEREKMLRQKEAALALLQTPFAAINFHGHPEQDIPMLKERAQQIAHRIKLFTDARDAYQISEQYLMPLQADQQHTARCLHGAEALKRGMLLFPSAHSYAQFRDMLLSIHADDYPPAAAWLAIRDELPAQNMLRVYSRKMTPQQLKDTEACLLGQTGSFPESYPATPTQLQLLEELFSNPALQKMVYEVSNAEGLVYYADNAPVVRDKRVIFYRSGLDPDKSMSHQHKVEWQDPLHVWSRKIDTTPLQKAAMLEHKPTFLMTANIPALLSAVLNLDAQECPALARAYVYHILAQVLEQHRCTALAGMLYTPTLKEHLSSFRKLQKDWKHVPLDGDCWLSATAESKAAEDAYARWFRKHSGKDYAKEITRNFKKLFCSTPQYCGYVNEAGEAILFKSLPPGTRLWYMGQDEPRSTPHGAPLEKPRVFSPLFSMQ